MKKIIITFLLILMFPVTTLACPIQDQIDELQAKVLVLQKQLARMLLVQADPWGNYCMRITMDRQKNPDLRCDLETVMLYMEKYNVDGTKKLTKEEPLDLAFPVEVKNEPEVIVNPTPPAQTWEEVKEEINEEVFYFPRKEPHSYNSRPILKPMP